MVDPTVDWAFELMAGRNFPQGDEDRQRAMAGTWSDLASRVGTVTGFASLARQVVGGVSGPVASEILATSRQLAAATGPFQAAAASQSDSLWQQAANTELTKYQILVAVVQFAADLLSLALDPFTAPLIPGFVASGRLVVARLLARYLGRAADLVMDAATQGAIAVLSDAVTQLVQIAQHHRGGLDLSSLGESLGFGIGGAVLARGLHSQLARVAPSLTGPGIRGVVGNAMVAAGTGVGMNLLATGDARGSDSAAANGLLAGAVPRRTHAAHESTATVPPEALEQIRATLADLGLDRIKPLGGMPGDEDKLPAFGGSERALPTLDADADGLPEPVQDKQRPVFPDTRGDAWAEFLGARDAMAREEPGFSVRYERALRDLRAWGHLGDEQHLLAVADKALATARDPAEPLAGGSSTVTVMPSASTVSLASTIAEHGSISSASYNTVRAGLGPPRSPSVREHFDLPADNVAIPAHVQHSQGLGMVGVTGNRDGARVRGLVAGLLPTPGKARVTGLDEIEAAATSDLDSFLGEGRAFPVTVGSEHFEAVVTARFGRFTQPADDGHGPMDGSVFLAGIDPTNSATAVSDDDARDYAVALGMTPMAGPSASISVRVPSGEAHATHVSSVNPQTFRLVAPHKGVEKVDAEVTWSVTLRDSEDQPAPPPDDRPTTLRGSVTLVMPTVPHEVTENHPWAPVPELAGERLQNVVAEVVTAPDPGLFDRVRRTLPIEVGRIGAPGRGHLREFLSAGNIRNEMGRMLAGWVTSADLWDEGARTVSAIQMRATLLEARLLSATTDTVGAHDATTMSHTVESRSDSGVTVSANVGWGGANPSGIVTGGGAITGGLRLSSNRVVVAGLSGKHEIGSDVTDLSGTYDVRARIDVRTPDGKVTSGVITVRTHINVRDAVANGLPSGPRQGFGTQGAPEIVVTGPEPSEPLPGSAQDQVERFPPPYFGTGDQPPSTVAAGNAKALRLDGLSEVREQIAATVRALPGFSSFLPDWRPGTAGGQRASRDRIAAMLANQRELDTILSPTAVKSRLDSLRGPGISLRLHRRGITRKDFVRVTVRADVHHATVVGDAPGQVVRGSDTREARLMSQSSREQSWSVGPLARLSVTRPDGGGIVGVAPNGTAVFSRTTGTSSTYGPQAINFSVMAGSTRSHLVDGDITWHVTVETFSRNRAWVRRITPGTWGTQTPKVTVLRTGDRTLPTVTGRTRLILPDASVFPGPADELRPRQATVTDLRGPDTIQGLLRRHTRTPSGPGNITEWLHVEAVTGTGEIRQAAIDAVTEAVGDDAVLGLPGTPSRHALDQIFSPEFIRSNLEHAVLGGIQSGTLPRWRRRARTTEGAVAATVRVHNARLARVSDTTATENSSVGGTRAGASVTRATGVDLTANLLTTGVHTANAGGATDSGGRGGATVTAKLYGRATANTKTVEFTGLAERKRNTPNDERTVLIAADAEVDIVAEGSTSNGLFRARPVTSGKRVVLPNSVFLRLSERQARELGVLPDAAPPDNTEPAPGTLAAPATMREGRPSALGLGVYEDLPRIQSLVWRLRESLGKAGTRLLPKHVLDDSMHNLQRMLDLTSRETVRAVMDSAIDGGVPLLAYEPKAVGHDAYQVVLHATAREPKFRTVENSGVKMNDILVMFRRAAAATARTASHAVGIRTQLTGLPAAAHSTHGQANLTPGIQFDRDRTAGRNRQTVDLVVHVLDSDGPTALYDVPMNFWLRVHRPDGTSIDVGRDDAPLPTTIRVLADNQTMIAGPARKTGEPPVWTTDPDAVDEATKGLDTWRSTGISLPHTAHTETLPSAARLRDTVKDALARLGAPASFRAPTEPAANSVDALFSSEMLRSTMDVITSDGLDMPTAFDNAVLPSHEATFAVHAKLSSPVLTGLSDHVSATTPRTFISGDSGQVSHVDTAEQPRTLSGDVSAALGATGDTMENPNTHIGDFEARRLTQSSTLLSNEVGSGRQSGVGYSGRSGLVTYDVDYRVVVTYGKNRRIMFDVHEPAGAQVRVNHADLPAALGGRRIPSELRNAQRHVTDAAAAWRDAERRAAQLQRTHDDLRPAVDQAKRMLAEHESRLSARELVEGSARARLTEIAEQLRRRLPGDTDDETMSAALDWLIMDTELTHGQAWGSPYHEAFTMTRTASAATAETGAGLRQAELALHDLTEQQAAVLSLLRTAQVAARLAKQRWWQAKQTLEARLRRFAGEAR
jgi:hypothetical protein